MRQRRQVLRRSLVPNTRWAGHYERAYQLLRETADSSEATISGFAAADLDLALAVCQAHGHPAGGDGARAAEGLFRSAVSQWRTQKAHFAALQGLVAFADFARQQKVPGVLEELRAETKAVLAELSPEAGALAIVRRGMEFAAGGQTAVTAPSV